jgi:alkaline phosphatase D
VPERFRHGVASFDPSQDSVLLWTLVEGGGPVRWVLATDQSLTQLAAEGTAEADPAAGTVVVDATGLTPGTRYWYRFEAGGERSPVGRTRTLPGDGAERIRLGATCCARYAQEEFGVYQALAAADVDVVVHLGDYIYEDAKGGKRPTEPDRTLVSLEDYRTRHSLHRRDPGLQALHAAHPVMSVWDDHDLADNAWRDGAKSHDREEHGAWADRKAAAVQAHNEFLPKRLSDPDDPTAAWRRLDAGDLVSLVLTETRAHRDEPVGAADEADIDDPDRTILGPAQRAWLLEQAADPAAAWVVLVSGTVVSELEFPAPDDLDGAMPEKYAVKDGLARNSDQWDGYPVERSALAAALAGRGGPALVLSGDIHSAWAVEGLRDGDGKATAVELVTPPAATTPAGRLLPPGIGEALGSAMKKAIDGARWIDLVHWGFLVVDIERARATATWWWVDPEDHTSAKAGRTWHVEAGPPPRLVDPRRRRLPWRVVAVASAATALLTLVVRRLHLRTDRST